ncbi:MAG: acyltransferase [Lachnospiraceae bacterium]|nr:acyltransferase [Lachnospiraceae bacterium]
MNRFISKEDSTALKGVAILWMIFHHLYHQTALFDYLNLNFYPFKTDDVLNLGIYAKVCVAIFAFVSGYGLYISYRAFAKKYVAKGSVVPFESNVPTTRWIFERLKKLMCTFATVASLSYIYFAIKSYFTGEEFFSKYGDTISERVINIAADIGGISKLLDTRSLNGAWWYISAAIIFVVIAPMIYSLLHKYGSIFVMGVIIVLPRILKLDYFGQTSIYVYMEVFAVGMVAAHADWFGRFEKRFCSNLLSQVITFAVLIAFWVLTIHNNILLSRSVYWEYHYIVVPLVNIFLCVCFIFKLNFVKSFFAFMGKYSTIMWLTHIFFRNMINSIIPENTHFIALFVILTLVSLAFAVLYEYVHDLIFDNRKENGKKQMRHDL